MNKTAIKKLFMAENKGCSFVTQGDIKRVMGWGNDRTIGLVRELDYISAGRTKQYMVDEVAAKIATQIIKAH